MLMLSVLLDGEGAGACGECGVREDAYTAVAATGGGGCTEEAVDAGEEVDVVTGTLTDGVEEEDEAEAEPRERHEANKNASRETTTGMGSCCCVTLAMVASIFSHRMRSPLKAMRDTFLSRANLITSSATWGSSIRS